MEIEDQFIITTFIKNTHRPRKVVDEYTIYIFRRFGLPKYIGEPIFSHFGLAVSGKVEHHGDVQPNVYRSPGVYLKMPWSYSIDTIWNVRVLVCWTKGSHLFCSKVTFVNISGTYSRENTCSMACSPFWLPSLGRIWRDRQTAEQWLQDSWLNTCEREELQTDIS